MAPRLRLGFACGALLLAHAGFGQDLSTPVTLTEKGAPARRVLESLGAKLGVTLQVDAAFASEPLILDVKAMPLSALMERIAEVLGGEWQEPKPGVHELKYTPARKAADWRDHLTQRTEGIQRSIDQIVKTADVRTTLDAGEFKKILAKRKMLNEQKKTGSVAAYEAAAAQEQKLPIGRALARLARTLDPSVLATLDWDERIVFSTAPTQMQRPLGPEAMAVIKALNAEHAAVIDAAQAIPDGVGRDPGNVFSDVPQWYREDLKRPISKIALIARRRGVRFSAIELVMCATDSTGWMSLYGTVSLMGGQFSPPDPSFALQRAPIVLSDAAKAYQEPLLATSTNMPGVRAAAGPGVIDAYLHPDRDEPLRFVVGESLIASARSQQLPLVASVPDEAFEQTFLVYSGKTTVGEYLRMLGSSAVLAKARGSLTVAPRDRYEALLHRTPRKALGRYLAAVRTSLSVSIDEGAAYALAYPYPAYSGIGMSFERALGRQTVIWSVGVPGQEDSRRALRVYGLLTPAQRRGLADGVSVPLIQLTPEAREALDYLIFRAAEARLSANPKNGKPYVEYPNIAWEPTESLPSGLPGETSLSLNTVSQKLPFSFPERSVGFIHAMNTETLAMNRLTEQDGNEEGVTIANKFRLGTQTAMTLHLAFTTPLHCDYHMMSATVDMTKPAVSYDQLPEDIRKAVEAAIKQQLAWRAQNKNRQAPPGKNPPPP